MKKFFALLTLATIAFACSSDKKEGNMMVKGQIKGLKKGTLYLQKMNDTVLVSVDSVKLLGKETFTLADNVNSPEMYFLTFDGNTTDKRILFFGEQGEITINDKVEDFGLKPEITGSTNQEVIKKYNKINKQFNDKYLEYVQNNFEAQKENDTARINALEKVYKKLVRRKYLFATNFALANKNSEAAAYIALTDLTDANITLLDTINVSLSDKVKNSTYGKQLDEFVAKIKKQEN